MFFRIVAKNHQMKTMSQMIAGNIGVSMDRERMYIRVLLDKKINKKEMDILLKQCGMHSGVCESIH